MLKSLACAPPWGSSEDNGSQMRSAWAAHKADERTSRRSFRSQRSPSRSSRPAEPRPSGVW
jgi:hypothetical protein